MSDDDLRSEIRAAIDAAVGALAQLPEDERTEPVARVEGALAFARVCVDLTDPGLITDATKQAIVDEAQSIAADPADAGQSDAHFNNLIAAVIQLPAARGRDVEQAVKEAAAKYQRSMAQRIMALEEQHEAARQALDETREQIASASEEVKTAIGDQAAELQSQVAALAAQIQAQQSALDAQLVRHTEAFNSSLEENTRKFQEAIEEQTTEAQVRIEESVSRVETVAKDVGVLAGTIALKGTADHYEGEASDQRSIADARFWLTVVVALGAVAIGVWAVAENADDTHALAAKVAISAALGGLAAYTAAQSSKHRQREVRAKDLQLQLTAFSPFIAPLHEDLQQAERVRMTRRTFGSTGVEEDDDEEEYGPNFLAAIRRILHAEPEPPSGA